MEILDALQWRYATKKYDASKKVDEALVAQILKAAHMAPSSSGLQPYAVVVISNQELKEKLVSVAFNQQQIADCSHLLVFAAWDNYTAERIDAVYDHIAAERGQAPGSYTDYVTRLKSMYLPRTADENFAHAARQAYIAFGIALATAAELKVDATPMEGFDNASMDEVLGLKEKGLKSVTLMPLGYRDVTGDWLVNLKKVRRPEENFFIEFK